MEVKFDKPVKSIQFLSYVMLVTYEDNTEEKSVIKNPNYAWS